MIKYILSTFLLSSLAQAMDNSAATRHDYCEHQDEYSSDDYSDDEESNISEIIECLGSLENDQITEASMYSNFFNLDHAKRLKNSLIQTTCLKSLTLEGNRFANKYNKGFEDGILRDLCFGLKANTTLTCLDLSANNLSGHEVKDLIESFKQNSSLNRLYLYDNRSLGDDGHGAAALSSLLKNNAALTVLDLSGCPLDSESIKTIFAGTKDNKTLKKFTFNSKMPCLREVAAALQTNLCLTDIRIDYRVQDHDCEYEYPTEDAGAAVLAQVLATNTSLQELSIINLKANCLMEFSQALKTNTVLRNLYIAHHDLTRENLDALATAISKNSTLKSMIIIIADFNLKEAHVWAGVLNALKKNTTLTHFCVGYRSSDSPSMLGYLPVYPICVDSQICQQMSLNKILEDVNKISYRHRALEIYLCCSTIPNELKELLLAHLILVAKKSPLSEWPHF